MTDASWPQRGAFLAALSRALDSMYCRAQWYPGSDQRRAAFQARFPQAQVLGRPVPQAGQPQGHLRTEPWLLVTGAGGEGGCVRDVRTCERCLFWEEQAVQCSLIRVLGQRFALSGVAHTRHMTRCDVLWM